MANTAARHKGGRKASARSEGERQISLWRDLGGNAGHSHFHTACAEDPLLTGGHSPALAHG
eukprot:scaffold4361_cov121-Isochrysis_galbana.AAC.2